MVKLAHDRLVDEALVANSDIRGRWFGEYGGRIVESHQLQSPETATTVHHVDGREPMITDGPFLEGNEVIGGYAVVEADDLDDALSMARGWPGSGSVEIRAVMSRPA